MVAEFTVAEFSGCPVFRCPVYRLPMSYVGIEWQQAQLSQRGVIKYFAKSLKITQGDSKWHRRVGWLRGTAVER